MALKVSIWCMDCGSALAEAEVEYEEKQSHAIDSAMTLVRNEIVLFSDANNLYNKDALLELVKPFFDPNVGGVSGSKNILESRDSLSKADGTCRATG